jgi:hypothetical protein
VIAFFGFTLHNYFSVALGKDRFTLDDNIIESWNLAIGQKVINYLEPDGKPLIGQGLLYLP